MGTHQHAVKNPLYNPQLRGRRKLEVAGKVETDLQNLVAEVNKVGKPARCE